MLNTLIKICSCCQGDIDPDEFEFVKRKAVKDMREHPEHPDRINTGASSPTRADPAADTPPGSPERLAKRRERELKVDALPTPCTRIIKHFDLSMHTCSIFLFAETSDTRNRESRLIAR